MSDDVQYRLTGQGVTDHGGLAEVLVEHSVSSDGAGLRIELDVPSFPPQVAIQNRTYQAGEFSKDVSAERIRIDAPLGEPLQPESGTAITLYLPPIPASLANTQNLLATGVAVFTSAPSDGGIATFFAVPLTGSISVER